MTLATYTLGTTIFNPIPLIPFQAVAGIATSDYLEEPITEREVSKYVIPQLNRLKADFIIKITGSSMEPSYKHNDIVACQRVHLCNFFQWNKIYVLDTTQGPLIKRVNRSKLENCLLLISDNKIYKPFDIPANDIYSIALVIGGIRFRFE